MGREPSSASAYGASNRAKITFSSGVEVVLLPFPIGEYRRVMNETQRRFPDPVPPKKTVEVVDGTEEVDDLSDAGYLEQVTGVQAARTAWSAEQILSILMDFCVELDLGKYQAMVDRLEKYAPLPTDPDGRRTEFINRIAARSRSDYELMIVTSLQLSAIESPEVAERLKTFPGNVARPEA